MLLACYPMVGFRVPGCLDTLTPETWNHMCGPAPDTLRPSGCNDVTGVDRGSYTRGRSSWLSRIHFHFLFRMSYTSLHNAEYVP
jgi:hypothetical protein